MKKHVTSTPSMLVPLYQSCQPRINSSNPELVGIPALLPNSKQHWHLCFSVAISTRVCILTSVLPTLHHCWYPWYSNTNPVLVLVTMIQCSQPLHRCWYSWSRATIPVSVSVPMIQCSQAYTIAGNSVPMQWTLYLFWYPCFGSVNLVPMLVPLWPWLVAAWVAVLLTQPQCWAVLS